MDVAEANPTYSSFDGALYSAGLTSLLLIPGGRQGAVRIPSQAADVPASAFSHCALVDAISVDAGGAHLSSWEGLLYDADGTALLRVPAGVTEIAIREGCTTIAAGAMEACASLARINAPSTVTSISPDVFTSVPTASLPAASVILSEGSGPAETEESNEGQASEAGDQLSAMVALSSIDDDLPEVDLSMIIVMLPEKANRTPWESVGFSIHVENVVPLVDSFAQAERASADDSTARAVFAPSGFYYYWFLNGDGSTGFHGNGGFVSWPDEWCLKNDGKVWYLHDGDFLPGYLRWYGVNQNGGVTSAVVRDHWNGKVLQTLSVGASQRVVNGDLCLNGVRPGWDVTWNTNQGAQTVEYVTSGYKGDAHNPRPAPTPLPGYVFGGWYTEPVGGEWVCGDNGWTDYITSPGLTYYAHWIGIESAVVPLDAEAQVDVLGLEAPKEAQGYIESRCGEPLKVARVDLTPLDGAKELFGASNVADVFLEVLANDGTSPNARFSLGALATESDASKLHAFTMGSYGAKVPISYRFAMPPEVQTSLVEHADPTPVCSVVYTVALQNPPT